MQNLPGPEGAPAAAVPAERKRKNRWDQGVPKEEPPEKMSTASLAALSAASAVKMQVVEAAATSVAQHGSQYEAVLQQQPQNAWLLQPSGSCACARPARPPQGRLPAQKGSASLRACVHDHGVRACRPAAAGVCTQRTPAAYAAYTLAQLPRSALLFFGTYGGGVTGDSSPAAAASSS